VQLGEKGVKSLEDLADLAGDELVEILGAEAVDEETANAVIMAARQSAGWFGDEPEADGAEAEAAGADEPGAETAESEEEAAASGKDGAGDGEADDARGG
jgi:N utilization substance protein A